MRLALLISLLFAGSHLGCTKQPTITSADSGKIGQSAAASSVKDPARPTTPDLTAWIGAYSSPSEIGGFSGTKLLIETETMHAPHYLKKFYSDVHSANAIEQDVLTGAVLIDGDHLYIPEADGWFDGGKLTLSASIERYTRLTVNGHVVLMRDDALKAFQAENKLYDYGILIKVSDQVPELLNVDEVEHKSIKLLYGDPTKKWQDPFVSGPNQR